ncbi:hypothetical protein HDU96_004153 [Phlyctochytrium bullatum]|nr:hypothetical protein HDU96_004153 [Phlyctochytrium bullatum]
MVVLAPGFTCGRLTVPLDHLNPASAGTIDIPFLRYSTPGVEQKGYLLHEGGGPSISAFRYLQRGFAEEVAAYANGTLHVVGYNPQGVESARGIKCFPDAAQQAGYDLRHQLYTSAGTQGSAFTFAEDAAWKQLYAKSCEENKVTGGILKYITTAYVARDLEAFRVAIKEPVLNFYGMFYSTVLGMTYANMFPETTGRIVLDASRDPTLWTGTLYKSQITGDDSGTVATLNVFGTLCAKAGPRACPLVSIAQAYNHSIPDVVLGYAQSLVAAPVVAPTTDVKIAWTLTKDLLLGFTGRILGSPENWQLFSGAATGDASQLRGGGNIRIRFDTDTPDTAVAQFAPKNVPTLSNSQVTYICNDAKPATGRPLKEWIEEAARADREAPLKGPRTVSANLACGYWKTRPVERYDGPWENFTKKAKNNKILIIGATLYESSSPSANSQRVSALLGDGARLLVHDGVGPYWDSQKSSCTRDVVARYLINGELVENGKVGKAESEVFDPNFAFPGM